MSLQTKGVYGLIAFVFFLVLVTPWARNYQMNFFFVASLFAAASYAGGVWILVALRDKGGTVIFMKDSLRKSRLAGPIANTVDSVKGRTPGMAALPYGGYSATAINTADVSLAVIPTSSIEMLSDDTTLVYAPTSPVVNPRVLKGLQPFFAKGAEEHPFLSFATKKRTRSEARIGFLNGLIAPVTTSDIAEQERMINRSGAIVDILERGEKGEESNLEDLQKLIRIRKKRSPMERARNWVFGETKTQSAEDKPGQNEPR